MVSFKQSLCATAYLYEEDALQICKEALQKQREICGSIYYNKTMNQYKNENKIDSPYYVAVEKQIYLDMLLIKNAPEPTWDE